jgi:hypothetical protein
MVDPAIVDRSVIWGEEPPAWSVIVPLWALGLMVIFLLWTERLFG